MSKEIVRFSPSLKRQQIMYSLAYALFLSVILGIFRILMGEELIPEVLFFFIQVPIFGTVYYFMSRSRLPKQDQIDAIEEKLAADSNPDYELAGAATWHDGFKLRYGTLKLKEDKLVFEDAENQKNIELDLHKIKSVKSQHFIIAGSHQLRLKTQYNQYLFYVGDASIWKDHITATQFNPIAA